MKTPGKRGPSSGADGRALCRAIRARGKVDPVFVEDLGETPGMLPGVLSDDDVLLVLGAGDVGNLAPELAELWPETANVKEVGGAS